MKPIHPYTIPTDGDWMERCQRTVHDPRPKSADSETITINLRYVDLGHIDLLVREGLYSNRIYFIRTAMRNQLDRHTAVVRQSIARNTLDLGLRYYSRADLEAVRNATCWTRDR